MRYDGLVFLAVGMTAGALNFAGVSTVAVEIAGILVLIGMVLVAIHMVTGRPARVA